jgi:uncharacterized protein YkwD
MSIMSRSFSFSYLVDAVCIFLICIYVAVAAYSIVSIDLSSGKSAPNTQRKAPQVLSATSKVMFPEQDNAPSPNAILSLVNEQRVQAGLSPLMPSVALSEIARRRADDMASNNYYSHRSAEGLFYYDYLSGSGADDTYSCENLDLQFSLAPSRYVSDWMESSAGHKQCLLNENVSDAGYAVSVMNDPKGAQTMYVVVAIHGTVE